MVPNNRAEDFQMEFSTLAKDIMGNLRYTREKGGGGTPHFNFLFQTVGHEKIRANNDYLS